MADLSHLDGHGWEDLLSRWHDRYWFEGLANVERQEPPVVSHRSRRLRRRKAGRSDFAGTLADGRRVVIEAKRSGDGHHRGFELRKIEPEQAMQLRLAHEAGSLAYVALLHEGVGRLIPWPDLAPLIIQAALRLGPQTLSRTALERWPVIDPIAGWLPLIDPLRIDRTPDRSGSDR